MSELKTLKDFDKITVKSYRDLSEDWYNGFDAGIHSMGSNLKQEAIKWIKVWKTDIAINEVYKTPDWIMSNERIESKIWAFKSFFNITDEDLK